MMFSDLAQVRGKTHCDVKTKTKNTKKQQQKIILHVCDVLQLFENVEDTIDARRLRRDPCRSTNGLHSFFPALHCVQ